MPDAAAAGSGGGRGPESLEPLLIEAAGETGASVTGVYLLSPDDPVLRLAVLGGIPWEISMPWARVSMTATSPVSDAVRERRLVWIGGAEEMARRYPRLSLVVPYRFTLAAAPITTGAQVWGGLVLHWPASHPAQLSVRERDAMTGLCRRLGLLLRQAAAEGRPVRAGRGPRVIPPLRARPAGPAEAQSAVDFAERLPGCCCSLDVDGSITFATTAAARLLGAAVPDLLGAKRWEALPWLDDPTAEDSYRAALISREPTWFTALRPPDQWLSFRLHPDASGISVYIAPTHSSHSHAPLTGPPRPHPAAAATPGRAASLSHLMHLAATLTEAVGVRDVVDQVAEQIPPAFGVRALALDRDPLAPGSVLALYTDGLVEAPGIDIDVAVESLARELARTGPGTMNALADALIRHARRSTPRSDDIALLLIHRER